MNETMPNPTPGATPDAEIAMVDVGADRRLIDTELRRVCTTALEDIPAHIAEPIRYALQGAGKRLRGILALYAYRAAGGQGDAAPLAAAIEIIHAYSLVHDDLPCMDDDSVRRGRPTTHVAYGTPAAVLAGAAMIPLAARWVVAAARGLALDDRTAAIIVETLMHAAGATGMIGGQLRDLRAEGTMLTVEQLETIHRAKTGALISASARIGGLAAGAGEPVLSALARYGADLGLAFQIVDDVLDVTATSEQLGKTARRDEALKKGTYPALLGVPGASERARTVVRDGCAALADVGLLTPELRHLGDLIITRTN